MAIIILLTRNQLIYRIHGKTNSNYTFTTIIRLYICFNFFFILLHNYRFYDSRHCKIQTKRVNVRRRNIRKYRKFSELGKYTEHSVEADRLWSDALR